MCAFCGSNSHSTTWKCGPPHCINCGESHHARSKNCVFYKYNAELKLLTTRAALNFPQAKRELAARGIKDPANTHSYRKKLTTSLNQQSSSNHICVHFSNTIPYTDEPRADVSQQSSVSSVSLKNRYSILDTSDNSPDRDTVNDIAMEPESSKLGAHQLDTSSTDSSLTHSQNPLP